MNWLSEIDDSEQQSINEMNAGGLGKAPKQPKKEVGLSPIPLIPINLIDSSPTSPYLFVFAIVTLLLIATKQIEFRE